MKVFNLACGADHRFEGWFGSQEDFEAQQARGLIACPLCGDQAVKKLPSAPRLNVSHLHREPAPPGPAKEAPGDAVALMQGKLLALVREVVKNTEDVGERFADEARRIHYGEVEERNIRGIATREEREALAEEGIEVQPLPFADLFKDEIQ